MEHNEATYGIIEKYSAPTKFDSAPLKSVWRVMSQSGHAELYIQLSDKPDVMRWEKMGVFLEKAFVRVIEDHPDFITECLRLFVYNEEDPLKKISEIIKSAPKKRPVVR